MAVETGSVRLLAAQTGNWVESILEYDSELMAIGESVGEEVTSSKHLERVGVALALVAVHEDGGQFEACRRPPAAGGCMPEETRADDDDEEEEEDHVFGDWLVAHQECLGSYYAFVGDLDDEDDDDSDDDDGGQALEHAYRAVSACTWQLRMGHDDADDTDSQHVGE